MTAITNPILRGFNPDPSILRVEDDYFIAASTFEWFPGVQIHHSKDLVHWRLLVRPLDRKSQLDLRGIPDSGGVWAPCLSHDGNRFFLVYSIVTTLKGAHKDVDNFVVTAPDILGPWSEPVYLNSSGFDPSLFHDADGRKWLVNQLWDHRPADRRKCFDGIVLQEYDAKKRTLAGPVRKIFQGTELGITEGPHLYRRGEYYYLMTAEGGTGYGHAVTMARSERIEGPYEVDPENPILTSAGDPGLELQKAGHGCVVETQDGEWYLAHLCSRPTVPDDGARGGRCVLGRETALQKCRWTDEDWFRLEGGARSPRVTVPAPSLPPFSFPHEPVRDDFDGPELGIHFQTLREPADGSWLSLTERPGRLRLYGRKSLSSRHDSSIVARRVQAAACRASARLEFEPAHFQQMAGITAFYNANTYYYLYVSRDDAIGKYLGILAADDGTAAHDFTEMVPVPGGSALELTVRFDGPELRFSYAVPGGKPVRVGPVLDAARLSDEHGAGGFTGAFIGLCVQDFTGKRIHADYEWFDYEEEAAT